MTGRGTSPYDRRGTRLTVLRRARVVHRDPPDKRHLTSQTPALGPLTWDESQTGASLHLFQAEGGADHDVDEELPADTAVSTVVERGPATCESCGSQVALLVLTYPDADPFELCQGCVDPALHVVAAGTATTPGVARLAGSW